MIKIDSSWNFLAAFYESDRSIVDVINNAMDNKWFIFRSESFSSLHEDIISFISKKDILSILKKDYIIDISFEDFLVQGAADFCNSDDNVNIENNFCFKLWTEIIDKSSDTVTSILSFPINDPCIPYLILKSMDIDLNWSLYGGRAEFKFEKEDNTREELFKNLKKGFKKKWGKSPFKRKLYSLMVLLIILKREYYYSKENRYLDLKREALTHYYGDDNFKLYSSLILGLYKQYKNADPHILDYCELLEHVEVHPLIAKNIIENENYNTLYEIKPSDFFTNRLRGTEYSETESYFNDRFTGKRLMVNYSFPFNIIRKDDIYIPHFTNDVNRITLVVKGLEKDLTNYNEIINETVQQQLADNPNILNNLLDLIYLSFQKGNEYKLFYRNPIENELFDYIQVEKNNNIHVERYRNNLKGTGCFIIVKSKTEREKEEQIRTAFSNFRHDFKTFFDTSDVLNLKTKFFELKFISDKVITLTEKIKSYINCDDNTEQKNLEYEELRSMLEHLEQEDTFKGKDLLPLYSIIQDIRDDVEDYVSTLNDKLYNYIIQLNNICIHTYDKIISQCINKTDNIQGTFKLIGTYIEMAGKEPENIEQDLIDIEKELLEFIKSNNKISNRIKITYDSSLNDNCKKVKFNKTILTIIFHSIVDNANKHGKFDEYGTTNPMIHFQLEDNENGYIRIKICNNGEPIDISTEEYKTRGVFSGTTGHTGIGGYQISLYAEQQGGYIEVYANKDWNTEIHLFIKKQS